MADTPDLGSGSARIRGSSPLARTSLINEIDAFSNSDTVLTQETAESEGANVKYPKRIKFRGKTLATIYGRCKGRDSYRVAWQVAGQRRMASFPSYLRAHLCEYILRRFSLPAMGEDLMANGFNFLM